MAAQDDGPNFSYAFGETPSWNPAFRPDHDSPRKSTFNQAEKLSTGLLDLEQAHDDDELPEQRDSAHSVAEASGLAAKPYLIDQLPASDDDFFDRYGSPEPSPLAPSAKLRQAFKSSKDQDGEPQPRHVNGYGGLEDIDILANEVQEAQESATVTMDVNTASEKSHQDSIPLAKQEHYEHQGEAASLEKSRQESAEVPILVPEPTTGEDWDTTEDWQIEADAALTHNQAVTPMVNGLDSKPESPTNQRFQQPDTSTATFSVDESALPTADSQSASDDAQLPEPNASFDVAPSLPKQVMPENIEDDWGEPEDDPFSFVATSSGEVFDGSAPNVASTEQASSSAPPTGDLADMWSAVLGDDDVLLDSDATTAFGFEDGEGFLEETPVDSSSTTSIHPPDHSRSLSSSKYTPADAQRSVPLGRNSSYLPEVSQLTDLSIPSMQISPGPREPPPALYQAAYQQPVQRPAVSSAQSFVDKSKGGYSSPFDLPEDISVKRRRPVHHSHVVPPTTQQISAPPRLSSMKSMPMIGTRTANPNTDLTSIVAQTNRPENIETGSNTVPSANVTAQGKPLSGDAGFFSDLPIAARPHRQGTPSGRYTVQPSNQPPSALAPPATIRATSTSAISHDPASFPSAVPHLRSPEKMPLYAEDNQAYPPSGSIPPASTRYSPATGAAPVKSSYSPVPPSSGNASRYSPAPTAKPPPGHPTRLPSDGSVGPPRTQAQLYAPRTSSPLAAHHTTPNHEQSSVLSPPQVVQQHDPQGPRTRISMDRVGSIVSLATVDENGNPAFSPPARPDVPRQPPPPSSRTNTPPPSQSRSNPSSSVSSPRKRGNYTPANYQFIASENGIVPPRRSQTSSPGTGMIHPHTAMGHVDRPSSVAALHGSAMHLNIPQPNRMMSSLQGPVHHDLPNLLYPQDSSAQDPLQRWKGAPIFHWGNGNHVIMSFPTYAPLYGGSQMGPMIRPVQGEVTSRNLGELSPQSELFLKFPGPLRKGKKRDVLIWLKNSVDSMEVEHTKASMNGEFTTATHQRSEERLLLWRVMHLLVEHDGVLEGTTAIEDAVRELITPASPDEALIDGTEPALISSMPEAFDPSAVKVLRRHLYAGEREKAVWHAVDQRLWAHALLIASTMNDKEIWKQVVQEFVRKEVRKTGDNTEALAALYQVFAGNWEESIDELVSVSARSGFKMVSTAGGSMSPKDALAGLDKWRETLTLILNNRSTGDAAALTSLGNLLSGYGRLEAGHICFLFARANVKFGGADDPQSHFTLLGGSAALQGNDFGKSLDTILLSEVYEFALSLAAPASASVPHLQSYKMYHAEVLAEAGRRSEAQQYCDAVTGIVTSKANRSAYYNPHLINWLDDFARRLSQAPADRSDSSWKPSIDKVSSSIWGKFNNFIAGDHTEATETTPPPTSDEAQYTLMASDVPPITRSTSAMDMYPSYPLNGAVSSHPSNSRYGPSNIYAPRSSTEAQRPKYDSYAQSAYQPRTSMESTRSAYEPRTPADGVMSASPRRLGAPSSSHSASSQFAAQAQNPIATLNIYSPETSGNHSLTSSYIPGAIHKAPLDADAPSSAYASPSSPRARQPMNAYEASDEVVPANVPKELRLESYGYEPPSSEYQPTASGYEPPSYQPYQPDDEPIHTTESLHDDKPKKKSFMDDEDDDVELVARAAALKKQQKSDADRAADEAFRKAAEADAAKESGLSEGPRGSWFGGWFGKKDSKDLGQQQSGPVKAKLGEENSFYFDKELNKWVNKKGGAAAATPSAPTPPPPRSSAPPSRSSSGVPPLSKPSAPLVSPSQTGSPASPTSSGLMGPPPPSLRSTPTPQAGPVASLSGSGPPSRPPSRPSTSMSNASDIDDLLGPAVPRRAAGAKKGARKGRYVDVMANKS